MYDILNSSFLHFSISTYFTIILTFCFPIRISKTDRYTIANRFAAVLLTSYKDTQCSKLRILSMHTPGAQLDGTMHPAIFLYAHSCIKVFIMWKDYAPSGYTGAKMYAPGSQNVHTGCRVHP